MLYAAGVCNVTRKFAVGSTLQVVKAPGRPANNHQLPGRRAACKDSIAQRSPIQAVARLCLLRLSCDLRRTEYSPPVLHKKAAMH
ncbi:hypothetical protein J6590_057699 [Homalodisca vitripennis]|nr:hypothetical protein J6590_057699 [Homalodisca vitripennis]